MKKKLANLITILFLMGFMSPCVNAASQPALVPTNIPTSFPVVKQDPTFTTVLFWYVMTGTSESAKSNIINWYNATEGKKKKIYVKGEFQDFYGILSNKLNNAYGEKNAKDVPDLLQLNSLSIYASYDLQIHPDENSGVRGRFVPIEDLMKADNNLPLMKKINKNLAAACSYSGKLIGIPFGNEMTVLHYNADAFRAVGLDPAKPPKTLAEYAVAAKKLLIKDKSGAVTRYGASDRMNSILLSTWIPRMTNSSVYQFDNEDGRKYVPRKFVAADNDTLKRILTQWKNATDTGAVEDPMHDTLSYDTLAQANLNARVKLQQGRCAMYMGNMTNSETTSDYLASLKNKSQIFDYRTARLPKISSSDAPGQTVGGYGIYIVNSGDKKRVNAAYEFVKFLCSVDVSTYWAATTGYYPTNSDVLDTAYFQDALKKNPLRNLSYDILNKSAASYTAREPWIPAGYIYNDMIGKQTERMSKGEQTVDDTVQNIIKSVNSEIKNYWMNCA